ncbi:MAG: HAD family hydrolase [Atopobiaceae bacterium]
MFDLDGTILTHHQGIAPRVTAAIKLLQDHGVATAVCSGRPRGLIEGPVTEAECMDYFVSANGACIADKDLKPLVRRPIEREDALRIFQAFKPLHAAWHVHLGMDTYAEIGAISYMTGQAEGKSEASLLSLIKRFRDFPVGKLKGWHNCISVLPRLKEAEGGIEKLDCSFPVPENMKVAERILEQEGIWEFAEMGTAQIEITKKGVTKGTGAEVLAAYLGIPKEATVAFGDGGNDMPLIGHVGHFVAMGNATEELKAKADEICPSIDEDGVAVWIESVLEEAHACEKESPRG